MARIIKKQNDLQNKHTGAQWLAILGWLLCIGGAYGFLSRMIGLPVAAIVFVIGAWLGATMSRKASIYRAGLSGERATAQIVRSLPDAYFAVQNLKVTYDGKTSELDLVVVGPTGVYVIETKNLKGMVSGDYGTQQWCLNKVGRGGTPYSKTFYSPVKQVGTHVYRLVNFLRDQGVHVNIQGLVYFANPETTVHLTGSPARIEVLSAYDHGTDGLCRYITGKPQQVSGKQLARIEQILG